MNQLLTLCNLIYLSSTQVDVQKYKITFYMINIATLNEYKAALLLPPPLQNTRPTIYNSVTNSWDDMLNCPHMTIVQSSSVECWSLDLLLDNSSVRVLLPFRVVFLPSTHHSSYPSNDSPSSDQCALPLASVIALGFLF